MTEKKMIETKPKIKADDLKKRVNQFAGEAKSNFDVDGWNIDRIKLFLEKK